MDDIMVVVAKAICASGCDCRGFGGNEKNTCDCYERFDNAARANDLIDMLGIPASTLAGLRDGTLVAVPREPTEAMHNAARDWSAAKYGKPIGIDASAGCWRAMLAAAPEAPALALTAAALRARAEEV